MANTPTRRTIIDLQEVTDRNDTARDIVAWLMASAALEEVRRPIEAALDDTPALAHEIRILRGALARLRRDRANLIAAMRAAIAATHEGESDPLWYLRDELHTQGYDTRGGRR